MEEEYSKKEEKEIKYPYSFPLWGPHESSEEYAKDIKQYESLVERMNK